MKPRHEKGRLAPSSPLLKETISTPAWRAMSHGARSLYVALKLRYSSNIKNNGRIYLSTRTAAQELGSNRDAIQRWFRELQFYGFIVMTDGGCLGVDGKGKAPHWRLTEIGYMSDPPTRDFCAPDGIFHDIKKQNIKKQNRNAGPVWTRKRVHHWTRNRVHPIEATERGPKRSVHIGPPAWTRNRGHN